MNIYDFYTDCGQGMCATAPLITNGVEEELILSHVIEDGTFGVKKVVTKMVVECQEIPTIGFRYMTIQSALELKTGIKNEMVHECLDRDYDIPMRMKTKVKDIAFSLLLSLAQLMLKEVEE